MSTEKKVLPSHLLGIANQQNSAIKNLPPELQPIVASRMHEIAARAEELQGPRARGASRKTAAIHEAGHVVVNRATMGGIFPGPYRVKVYPEYGLEPEVGEVWLGCTENPPGTPDTLIRPGDVSGMHIHALRILAGVVAERLFNPTDYRLGSSIDEQIVGEIAATNIAREIGADHLKVLHVLHQLTADVLRINQLQLLKIAAWLEKHSKLGGNRLTAMLEGIELPAELVRLGMGGGK